MRAFKANTSKTKNCQRKNTGRNNRFYLVFMAGWIIFPGNILSEIFDMFFRIWALFLNLLPLLAFQEWHKRYMKVLRRSWSNLTLKITLLHSFHCVLRIITLWIVYNDLFKVLLAIVNDKSRTAFLIADYL